MKNVIILLFVLIAISSYGQKKFKAPGNFKFIPQGNTYVEDSLVNVNAFYIFAYEISNINYREYLMYLKNNSGKEAYKKALLDTNNFSGIVFNEPFTKFYHRHSAYNNYPVLNIRHDLAKSYCEWLGMILSEKYPDYELTVRLPTKEEWIRAARGDKPTLYSWGSFRLVNEDGQLLCNFKSIGSESIHYNRQTEEYEVLTHGKGVTYYLNRSGNITTPVNAYWENEFGLYNMCGNAAEMIDEEAVAIGGSWMCPGWDVRVESVFNYTKSSIEVGFRPVLTFVKKKM